MILTLSIIALIFFITTVFFYSLLQNQKRINQNQNSELIRINNDLDNQLNLWDEMNEVVIVHSISGSIIKTNEAFRRLLGYPPDLWENQLLINLVHPEHIPDYEIYSENLHSDNSSKGIMHLLDVNNKECIFEYKSRIYRHGSVIFAQWIGLDVTKAVSMHKSLKTAEKKFDILFDLLPDSGFILDIGGLIQHCSRNIKNLIGYNVTDIIGKPISQIIVPRIQDDSEIEFEIDKLEVQVTELVFKHRNGQAVPVLIHSQPFYDDKDNFIGIFVICFDQSARKKLELEKELFESQFQHKQKSEILGMLAGGIAHDFNNILSAVLGFADIALEDLSKGLPAKESLEEIISAGQYGRDLVRQILLFNRKAGQVLRPVKIKPILKQSIKLIRGILPPHIEISVRISLNEETINTDPVQIHQVLFNLFINAIHAMKQNLHGILSFSANTIEVKKTGDSNQTTFIRLLFEDNGCGIAPDELEKIYEPFYTTKDEGEGSGIGLSIVHSIVRRHRGTISVKSEPGKGSAFTILLPIAGMDLELSSEMKDKKIVGKGKILLADKNQSVLKITKKVLTSLGYQVTDINDPDQALRKIQKNPRAYDLVITDHLVPKYAMGYLAQLIHEIRKDLPIIILSGYIEESTLDFRREEYVFSYLDKPVNPVLLSKTVAEALNQSEKKIKIS